MRYVQGSQISWEMYLYLHALIKTHGYFETLVNSDLALFNRLDVSMENYLQTPFEIRSQIWKELTRSVNDKHHAWRTPVLSTVALDEGVNSRTVVLRGAHESENHLLIYTDARSAKVSELEKNSQAFIVFWSPRLHWQLRVKVNISTHTTGPLVDQLWAKVSQSAAASDYISPSAPGTQLVADFESVNTDNSTEHHFAVLVAQIHEMDWLELSRNGHRRAKIIGNSWDWLTP